VLPPRSPKLNGRVERRNGTSRREFWACYDGALDLPTLQAALRDWATFDNPERPHQALEYETPAAFLRSKKFSDVSNEHTPLTLRRCVAYDAGTVLPSTDRATGGVTRRNHWHPGHGAMGDTCPGPCMGTGHGIAITGSAPPDQVIVHPDDAATLSGEALLIPGLYIPRPWGTLEVRHRARSCFPEPGPRGRGPGTEQCSSVPVDQGSSQSHDLLRAWEPPAQGSNRLDDDTGRSVRNQDVNGVPANTRHDEDDRRFAGQRPIARCIHCCAAPLMPIRNERGTADLPGTAVAGTGFACQWRTRERIDEPATISIRNRHALANQAPGGGQAHS
jgi:Integrase core domain